MEGIEFRGRGFSEPLMTIDTDENGARFRFDCGHNAEVWATLMISPEQLGELLGRVCVHLGADGDVLVPLLAKLTAPILK